MSVYFACDYYNDLDRPAGQMALHGIDTGQKLFLVSIPLL